jgi:hypothetical protein
MKSEEEARRCAVAGLQLWYVLVVGLQGVPGSCYIGEVEEGRPMMLFTSY